MKWARVLVSVVALALLGVAGLVLSYPPVAHDVVAFDRLRTAIERLEEPELVVFTVVGLLLVGFAAIDTILPGSHSRPATIDLDRRLSGLSEVQTGRSFETDLSTLARDPSVATRAKVRSRLRSVATTVLTRATDLSADAVGAHLDDGTWTDNVRAAVYFTDTPLPFTYRVRDWLAAENSNVRQIDHVLSELEAWQFDQGTVHPDDVTSESEATPRSDSVEDADSILADGSTSRGPSPEDNSLGRVHRVGSEESVTSSVEVQPETAGRDDLPTPTDAGSGSDGEGRPEIAGIYDTVVQTVGGTTKRVRHQEIGISVAFFATGLGLTLQTTVPFLVAIVATVYAAQELSSDVSTPAVRIERELGTRSPVPGDRVEVSVRLTNTGEGVLTDLRYVDGVPESLSVVAGTPSTHTALRPGETWEFSYTIKTKRGVYEFDESDLLRYSVSGIREWHATVEIDSRIEAATLLEDFLIADDTLQRIGTVETDEGGSGNEFHSVREYRTGDPLNRINWNQLAKTGDLSTVEFRRQRGTTVVLFLDARTVNEVSASPDELDGVDLSIYAAEQVFHALRSVGTEIGLFKYTGDLQTVEPDTSEPHRESVVASLREQSDRYASLRVSTSFTASSDSTSMSRPERGGEDWFDPIANRLPRTAHVVFFSPLVDDTPIELVRQFRAHGYSVTLLSPDVTAGDSAGCRVAALERAARVQTIRATNTYVADWDPNTSLQQLVTRIVRHYHH